MGMEKVDDDTYLISGKVRDSVDEISCIHVGGSQLSDIFKTFSDKYVTLRYWVFNRAVVTVEEATELMLEDMFSVGGVTASCTHHWSELTGYLYTTEQCIVGGHDILHQLKGFMGLHVLMEITINRNVTASAYISKPIKQLTSTEFLKSIVGCPPCWKGIK